MSISGRRGDIGLRLFPDRQLVQLRLPRQLRSNIDVDDIRPRDVVAGKLWAIREQHALFADDLRSLPSVTEQMNQRPVTRTRAFNVVQTGRGLGPFLQLGSQHGVVQYWLQWCETTIALKTNNRFQKSKTDYWLFYSTVRICSWLFILWWIK